MLSNSIQCGFESHPGHDFLVGARDENCCVYPVDVRRTALSMVAEGLSLNTVSKRLSISRSAIREWRDRPDALDERSILECPAPAASTPEYAALFGFYLGDGCISRARHTYSLRVSCDATFPGIVADVADCIKAVRGDHPVGHVRAPGVITVQAYWNHWPCLFPQHGPGRKHERTLPMVPWQWAIVEAHPADFLRGLFHSDGCRVRNWATRIVAGEKRRYEYGRWQFTNESADIMRWCGEALDLVGIPWRQTNRRTLSVSRRDAVAMLDALIGPKR